jgi:Domain of unknown function (DUF4942)
MFDKEYYPTPPALIEKMMDPYKKEYHKGGINGRMVSGYVFEGTILDPEAGGGAILDWICDNSRRREPDDIYVCEHNPDLQVILKDKGYQMVGSDFLTYECDMYYDYIFMNPPFSNGDEHLLKAIEIADDTHIVCILNAETTKNPYSQKRKELMTLIDKYEGSIEYHENEFLDAERTTSVEIAIVRVAVPQRSERFNFDFSDLDEPDININEDFMSNEVARKDVIGNMIIVFEQAREAYIEYMKAQAKWQHLGSVIWKNSDYGEDMTTVEGSYKDRYNFFSRKMKAVMWKTVIGHLNIEKFMSHSVIQNFEKFIKQQSKMAFTKENTRDFFEMIMMNSGNILEKAIVEVFDMLTERYHENRMSVEGWKTNDSYKVNKKVIFPYGVRMSWEGHQAKEYGTEFRSGHHIQGKYSDIDKVMCYIGGKDLDKILTIDDAMRFQFKEIGKIYPGDKFNNTCKSEFFEIKFFKKGTVHLKFRDEKLWQEFNMRACKEKNWLPEGEYEKYQASKPENKKPIVPESHQLEFSELNELFDI